MKIAVYSLTRDRLDYSKICFASLQEKAGVEFDHYVLDNNSTDGTKDWLLNQYNYNHDKSYLNYYADSNLGISKASNKLLDIIFKSDKNYDLICKVDNDALIISDNILGQISEIYRDMLPYSCKFVLSPRVEGIVNQPRRIRDFNISGRRIGQVGIVGGLFHCVPAEVYKEYRYPENLPLAKGQDDHFCDWFNKRGGAIGYIEGLIVEHYEGTNKQAERYPDYFKRKFEEENLIPTS